MRSIRALANSVAHRPCRFKLEQCAIHRGWRAARLARADRCAFAPEIEAETLTGTYLSPAPAELVALHAPCAHILQSVRAGPRTSRSKMPRATKNDRTITADQDAEGHVVAIRPFHQPRFSRIARILRRCLRRPELERPVGQRRTNLRACQLPCGLGQPGGLRSDPDRKRAGEEKPFSRTTVREHGGSPYIVALQSFCWAPPTSPAPSPPASPSSSRRSAGSRR